VQAILTISYSCSLAGFGRADSSRDEIFFGHRFESQAVSDHGNNRLEKIRERIKEFPTGPGLYFMKDADDIVLYIGKAKNLRARVSSYFQPSSNLEARAGRTSSRWSTRSITSITWRPRAKSMRCSKRPG
jgi:hypothetical protein